MVTAGSRINSYANQQGYDKETHAETDKKERSCYFTYWNSTTNPSKDEEDTNDINENITEIRYHNNLGIEHRTVDFVSVHYILRSIQIESRDYPTEDGSIPKITIHEKCFLPLETDLYPKFARLGKCCLILWCLTLGWDNIFAPPFSAKYTMTSRRYQ